MFIPASTRSWRDVRNASARGSRGSLCRGETQSVPRQKRRDSVERDAWKAPSARFLHPRSGIRPCQVSTPATPPRSQAPPRYSGWVAVSVGPPTLGPGDAGSVASRGGGALASTYGGAGWPTKFPPTRTSASVPASTPSSRRRMSTTPVSPLAAGIETTSLGLQRFCPRHDGDEQGARAPPVPHSAPTPERGPAASCGTNAGSGSGGAGFAIAGRGCVRASSGSQGR